MDLLGGHNPIHVCVVAVVNYYVEDITVEEGEEPISKVFVTVQQLFPHGHTCSVSFLSRPEILMSPEHGGNGHWLFENFPQDVVFGDTYDHLTEEINCLKPEHQTQWKRIINAPKGVRNSTTRLTCVSK